MYIKVMAQDMSGIGSNFEDHDFDDFSASDDKYLLFISCAYFEQVFHT